ncbi:murein transglycosylase A [Salidesulfovibrio onnuriiensis]|uniref:murein transglycosylase A n=1 Tax=Salidesulfovibrio onnuriiensis TaxID=2583823 RepID=UPI00202B458D|nr:MltA domain-containing protein [Salidesulfovibrio onnuriiensis]
MRSWFLAAAVAVLLAIVLFFHFVLFPPKPKAPEVVEPSFLSVPAGEAEQIIYSLSPFVQGYSTWTAFQPALEKSLAYAEVKNPASVAVDRPGLTMTWGELAEGIREMIDLLPLLDKEPALMAERFRLFRFAPQTLMTGYYEPWLEASPVRTEEFKYPLYGLPADHKMVDLGQFHPRWKGQQLVYRMTEDGIVPYYDRKAIDGQGALDGKGNELGWARDLVDVFMLQVQGSGRLVMPDGSVRHILYAGKNGHPYVSVGKVLIDQGLVPREEMSMKRIKRFFEENPDKCREMLFRNPSYVFFRLHDEGPFGSIGKVLTPMVSVAVDRNYVPLGSLMLLDSVIPRVGGGGEKEFRSLVTAQDTGGAIKNTRCDLFCGTGTDAEYLAGHLQHNATLYMLVSKRAVPEDADQQ